MLKKVTTTAIFSVIEYKSSFFEGCRVVQIDSNLLRLCDWYIFKCRALDRKMLLIRIPTVTSLQSPPLACNILLCFQALSSTGMVRIQLKEKKKKKINKRFFFSLLYFCTLQSILAPTASVHLFSPSLFRNLHI